MPSLIDSQPHRRVGAAAAIAFVALLLAFAPPAPSIGGSAT